MSENVRWVKEEIAFDGSVVRWKTTRLAKILSVGSRWSKKGQTEVGRVKVVRLEAFEVEACWRMYKLHQSFDRIYEKTIKSIKNNLDANKNKSQLTLHRSKQHNRPPLSDQEI